MYACAVRLRCAIHSPTDHRSGSRRTDHRSAGVAAASLFTRCCTSCNSSTIRFSWCCKGPRRGDGPKLDSRNVGFNVRCEQRADASLITEPRGTRCQVRMRHAGLGLLPCGCCHSEASHHRSTCAQHSVTVPLPSPLRQASCDRPHWERPLLQRSQRPQRALWRKVVPSRRLPAPR